MSTPSRAVIAHAYKTKPNYEKAAGREIERQGTAAIIPFDDSGPRIKVTAPGYVFPTKHVDKTYTRHVGQYLGPVYGDLTNLYVMKPKEAPARDENPFKVGQAVYRGEVPAKVIAISGRTVRIETVMLGKQHQVAIHYSQLRPG